MWNTLIDARELHAHLDDPAWLIVDCRFDLSDPGAGYRSYLAGHIPGSVYAHLDDHLSGPPVTDHGRHPMPTPKRLTELFSELGISPETQVVAYDAAYGSIAARLWWMLRYMQHPAAAVLDGGWQAWLDAGLPLEEDEQLREQTAFTGSPAAGWLVTAGQVPEVACLIDSRDPARFRGEVEPIDPVAGHIPGALNHFWRANIDEQGRFLPPQRLRRQFGRLMGDVPSREVTFYCGSGVTACHNVLAAVHAGLEFPRLYAGSWSDWCGDPSRPVAPGRSSP